MLTDPVILLSALGMLFMFVMGGYLFWFFMKQSKKERGEE